MTSGPLHGLRVVEFSAFVAAPSAGLALAQLGAEVIRIDPLGDADPEVGGPSQIAVFSRTDCRSG